jgi:hypothetical protein
MSTVQRDGQPAADAQGPTVPRMLVGIELHRYREAAGITPDQAAYEIRASRSKISRMENGLVRFKERDVTDLLTLYGITDEQIRSRLVTLARQASTPGWWSKYGDIMADWFESYLGLETAASVIRTFELQFVHGLFQTEDLLASPQPPQVWSVLDEGALRRPVGGRRVMRAQLEHLAEVARLRHVSIQVVPFDRGGHAAAGGSFTVLRFSEPEVPDVVYLEQLTSALYLDKLEDVDHYLEVMNHLSTEALTPAQTVKFVTELIQDI